MHQIAKRSPDLAKAWVTSCITILVALLFVLSGVEDAFADQVTSTIPSGPATDVATNPITNLVYVTHHGSGTVDVVNGSDDAVVSTIQLEPLAWGVAVNSATNIVYVTHYDVYATSNRKGNLSVIDGSSGAVAEVTVGIDPFDVAVNPNTNMVYVSDTLAGQVFAVNGSTGTVVASIPVGEVYGIAVNVATNRIYAVYSCSLAVIDGSSSTVINTFSVSCPLPSHDVAVNQVSGTIYIGARYTIEVFDGSTYARIASISPGCNTPYTLDMNSATDEVYVTCINNNLLSVIDGATNGLVQTIALDASPRNVAANLANNETYVATSSGVTVVA